MGIAPLYDQPAYERSRPRYDRGGAGATPAFVSTWDTRNTSTGSSASNQIALPLVSGGTYDFEVDWGDGSSDTITAFDQAEVTHTYAAEGEYEVRITGTITGWQFNNGGDRLKLLTVDGGGVLNPGSDVGQFRGCTNMTSLSGLDTSSVTRMNATFLECSGLTSLDLTSFDTSSVTDMSNMFNGCSSLTSLDLTSFNTSLVTSMLRMFLSCSSLTSLDFTSFNTSLVVNMKEFVRNCTGLSSVDVTGLDTSSVTDMENMFFNCPALANNFDPSGFDVTSLTTAANMMNGTSLTTAVYDALLVAWEAQAVNDSVAFHAGTSTYTSGGAAEAARTALINDHSWTITDGGAA